MRVFLVVLLGFIFASCSQDYDKVHGIKIGAPISEIEDLDSYTKLSRCEITVYYKNPFGEYKEAIIFELDGKVAALSVRVGGVDEIRDYIDFMAKAYGAPDITPDGENEDNYKFTPKGRLFKIEADRIFSGLTVIYSTEKIDSIADDVFERCDS